jgi:hypothetical protein
MANVITAGNSSNGGTAITTDTSGTLNIVTGSGSGSNAITIDASQNVTFANAISVAGSTTITGALAVTGSITASGGVSGSITSGTAVASTSGTSVTFTGIPSTVKRITVLFDGVSTSGTSLWQVQIGSGSVETSGYQSGVMQSAAYSGFTAGFGVVNSIAAADTFGGMATFATLGSNVWVYSSTINRQGGSAVMSGAGRKTTSGTIDRIRITTVNGTDTFDAGSINILFE